MVINKIRMIEGLNINQDIKTTGQNVMFSDHSIDSK